MVPVPRREYLGQGTGLEKESWHGSWKSRIGESSKISARPDFAGTEVSSAACGTQTLWVITYGHSLSV